MVDDYAFRQMQGQILTLQKHVDQIGKLLKLYDKWHPQEEEEKAWAKKKKN